MYRARKDTSDAAATLSTSATLFILPIFGCPATPATAVLSTCLALVSQDTRDRPGGYCLPRLGPAALSLCLLCGCLEGNKLAVCSDCRPDADACTGRRSAGHCGTDSDTHTDCDAYADPDLHT